MFSHNSGQHRSRTLAFELFRFWLRIRGDIRNRKSAPRIGESGSRLFEQMNLGGNTAGSKRKYNRSGPRFFTLTSGSSLGRYVFGSEISYNKPPPRLPGLAY